MTDSDSGERFPTEGVRLEAVVDGRVAPEHLTRSEKLLLDLADAARGPASTKEIAGLGDALVVFAAQQRDAAESGATWSRSRHTLGRMRSAGAVAAVVVVLGAGAAAAATAGDLPTPLQHIAHNALGAPEPGRHTPPRSTASHETRHHSAGSESSSQPSASTVSTGDTSPVSAVPPSSSPRSSGQGKPGVGLGAAAAAHHHHHVAPKHPRVAHPKGSAHSQQNHTHHKKHHQGGSGSSGKPTPKPSPSGSKSPRH